MNWTERYRLSHNNWCKAKGPGFYEASGGDSMKVPYPKVTSSNGLTRAVLNFLTWDGHHAERINNMGRPVDKRETYIDSVGRYRVIGSLEWQKGTGTNGTADVHADLVHKDYRFPIPVKLEIKYGKDKMRDAQKDYEHLVTSKGGVYIVVKTIQGFFEWYDEFLLSLGI
jgi:hypothetical protein